MGPRGNMTGKGGLEVGPRSPVAPHWAGGELSPPASQSVPPADAHAVSLNVFIVLDSLKCFQTIISFALLQV